MAIVVVVSMVASTLVLFAPEASARTGSDSFGYTFKDSAESDGPVFADEWIELVGHPDATLLISSSTDAGQSETDIGFTFEYYETEYTTWGNGGDNGYINLGSSGYSYYWTPYRIPYAALNVAIFGGWFDGGFCRASNSDAGVYYATVGDAPNRKLVVQYEDQGAWYPSVYQCPGTAAANALTWQIVLHEGTNQISINYEDAQGGYSSDNEYLTSGIQGKPGGELTGLEYVYRRAPSAVTDESSVLFSPPPPARNDLRLKSTVVPDPMSLADDNVLGATVSNYGVNCDTAGSCTPVPEENIDVTAKIFSIKESVNTYDFDDDDGGFTSGKIQGVNSWTNALNDGKGNHNYGDEGSDDGSWSSGRKSTTLGGMFNDQQGIHYDGTNILIADKGSDSVLKLDVSTNDVTTVIATSYSYLNDVIDITDDGTYYYTLARTSGTYSSMTKVCKWLISDTTATPTCNTSNVRYGTSLTHYNGELFALQTSSSSSYRKVIILDASDMSLESNFAYSASVPSYYYAHGIAVDESTGDIYLGYRDFYGRVRQYERDSDGDYSSSDYKQIYTYARYHTSVEVHDDFVYTSGFYSSSYYGGMKKYATGATSGASTLWSSYGTTGYKGSIAITDDGDIYVSSNYQYNYYSFYNWDDKIWIHENDGGYSGTADTTLGPNPASLSYLSTPAYDTSDAIGMSMKFKVSWQMYYRYEGAYLESSVDGGNNWDYVSQDNFISGGYYGTVFATYGNPVSTSIDTWTYYNTNNRYSYNTNTAPWQTQELVLDSYTGYSDVRFRWVVGFNQYDNTYYYDSYFRLDDVEITVKEADETFAEETQVIASLGFKEQASVDFFTVNKFRPSTEGLSVGDKLAVMINIEDNGGDQDMSNNRDVQFREVKYVIFADDFEDGDGSNWEQGKVKYGSGDSWEVRDRDSNAGSYSMDSGYRRSNTVPADNYIATPNLDLTLPVEAELQMFISYYAYYTYDGYQVQASGDGGDTWAMIEPNAEDAKQYYTIYNYAYYSNPLRGLKGYAYYGSSTGFTYSPDPQGWVKATFDLTEYCGNNDVRVRVVTGWSTLSTGPTYFESFFRFDDIAVTGLVYNDNVGLTGFELPDPLGVDSTVPVEATVINAGINDQTSGAATVRMQLGPMGIEEYASSDDLESYSNEAAATTAGWSTSDDCNTTYSTCSNWYYYGGDAGFVLNTDEGDGDETNSWGSDGGEFQMYYGAGSVSVTTPSLDFSGASSDLKLTMKHRYNFDYYAGYTSYNGGQAQISVDGGSTWTTFVPSGGYPGTMYNYAPYGNPLYGQAGFVHCSSCPGSGAASDDEDEYISTEFDMSAYVDMDDVMLKFVVGMYRYQWPGDGEHWHIDSLAFTGTGMESVAYEETWDISGSGAGGAFASGEAQVVGTDYYFQVPGEYKVVFDAWIGDNPSDGDDFAGDNSVSLARETMFTVVGTTADEAALTKKNDDNNDRWYDSGWHASVDGGPKDSFQWQPSATTGANSAPVWWSGTDAYGSSYNGDDTSLVSPVFDLSTATSAKLVFNHKFAMHGFEYSWANYYYDGGRIEISTDAGETWSGLNPTSGLGYGGTIYNYAYYGNPLRGQSGFVMGSDGWQETQCRLDAYTGEGFDQVQIRFRLGGTFFNNPTFWEIDDVGVYGLGFDLAQTSESTPYTLEIGEEFVMSTSFKNQGMGDLGPAGAVSSAYAYAYVNDMSGNEMWSSSSSLGTLAMAYYDDAGNTFAGEATDIITFNFPGMTAAGLYTAGIKVADSEGNTLSDLFMANNDASHMLIVGKSADMGSPLLTGGENWAATENEPATVGDGAMGVSWDRTSVATESLAVSIGGQASGFDPASPEVQVGTTVTWTNSDTITHTVTDKNAQFDSFDIGPGESWSLTFNEVGFFEYYCKYHPMMEGSIDVTSSQSADEQVRTNYIPVWSSTAYLVFWANFEMSEDSDISIYAQKKGASLDDADTLGLWGANGFAIMDGADHEEIGDSLSGKSDGWNPYYMSLDSKKLGYSSLSYDPADDNAYSFVFRARGVEGTAHIGGVEVIRTLDTGFFLTKDDVGQLTYDIFPSLAVEMDYFAKNIGTLDNTFRMTPELEAQGKSYDGAAFDISINVMMNGNAFEDITGTQNEDGTWTYEFDMAPDDEAMITVRFGAPDYDQESGEPAGNRKFDVIVNGYDVGSDEALREPVAATLFIKPSQFVLGEMTFDRSGVIEGDALAITVKAWNEGNYASDVLVVFYVMDSTGDAYSTPDGVKRMSRVASTTVPMMAPKPVLENDGVYQTWYHATATWEEAYIPGTTIQAFETVEMYAMINPDAEQQDVDAGVKTQDEYLNQKDDNDAVGTIAVVKSKASTPSFAVGIIGLSVAALVASIGASLRREEE